jgi:ABC-type lipopolysaccharide export system ATPase subunit
MKLHVDSVQIAFDNRPILQDVYLECNIGEVVGLLGRNGSGKSTLLKIIHHSQTAESKYVKAGEEVILSQNQAVKYLSYLPQDGFLPKKEKVTKLARFCIEDDQWEAFANHPIIQPILDRTVAQLSGGEQRLLEVYMLLYSPAPFILLDEPFNGIAPIYVEDIKNLIRTKLSTKGILLTDHSYRNVLDVSHRIVLLKDGRTVNIKDRNELYELGYVSHELA